MDNQIGSETEMSIDVDYYLGPLDSSENYNKEHGNNSGLLSNLPFHHNGQDSHAVDVTRKPEPNPQLPCSTVAISNKTTSATASMVKSVSSI